MTELEAINETIKKWTKILNGKKENYDCALCEYAHDNCNNCPIVIYGLGNAGCEYTAYSAWNEHQKEIHGKGFCQPKKIECSICKDIVLGILEKLTNLKIIICEQTDEKIS